MRCRATVFFPLSIWFLFTEMPIAIVFFYFISFLLRSLFFLFLVRRNCLNGFCCQVIPAIAILTIKKDKWLKIFDAPTIQSDNTHTHTTLIRKNVCDFRGGGASKFRRSISFTRARTPTIERISMA